MKYCILTLLLFNVLILNAQKTKLVFMPQWTAQTQFAGYYVAKEKGFYDEAGLDVEIRHVNQNMTKTALDFLNVNEVQIAGAQMFQAIKSISEGAHICNVCQLSQNNSLWCVSHEKVSQLSDLNGKKIGKWKTGFSELCEILVKDNELDIEWVPFISGINLYVYGAVDAILCYSYSEYIKILLSVGKIEPGHVLRFSDMGYNYPEDGLYVNQDYYKNHKSEIDAFVKATIRGWIYAKDNRNEAIDITMKYVRDNNINTNLTQQKLMLDEMLRLFVNPISGKMDFAPIDSDVFIDMVDQLYDNGFIMKKISYNELIM